MCVLVQLFVKIQMSDIHCTVKYFVRDILWQTFCHPEILLQFLENINTQALFSSLGECHPDLCLLLLNREGLL